MSLNSTITLANHLFLQQIIIALTISFEIINKMLKISKLSVMLKQLDRMFLKYNYKIKSDKILQLYSDIKEYDCKSKHTNELGILIGYFL